MASYKFALGQALLRLGAAQQTFVPMQDLAAELAPMAGLNCEAALSLLAEFSAGMRD